MTRPPARRLDDGFSLIEVLVVIFILLTVTLISWPALERTIERSKLLALGQQVAMLMQRARLESIKRSVPAVIRLDLADRQVFAFADVNNAGGDPVPDGLFNPVDGRANRTTDYEIARLTLPHLVSFGGPSDASPPLDQPVDGFGTTDGTDGMAVFRPDGTAAAVGAFRFGTARNNLEVRVEPATMGRVFLRKYLLEAPGGAGFYENFNEGHEQPVWVWY